jgi:hypothetical protein
MDAGAGEERTDWATELGRRLVAAAVAEAAHRQQPVWRRLGWTVRRAWRGLPLHGAGGQ